jgi:hypothetical protein
MKSKAIIILITCILIVFWWFPTIRFIQQSDTKLLTLIQTIRSNSDKTISLLPDNKVSSDFVSKYNNLGIIAIRFNTFSRINNDTLTFRLKEKGQSDWYYQNNYKTDQFQDQELFPFGFPIISDSKNKTYIFEIQSQHGKADDAVAISQIQPILVSKYTFTINELFHQKRFLLSFIFNKTINILSDVNITSYSFSFLLPLYYFLIFSIFRKNKVILSGSIFLICLIQIIFISKNYDLLLISTLLAWLININLNHLKSQTTTQVSLIFFTVAVSLFTLRIDFQGEKAIVWSYLFLIISIIQNIKNKIKF